MTALTKIFKEYPAQWGLRGDPHLWEVLSRIMSSNAAPMQPEQFNTELDRQFKTFLDANGRKKTEEVVWVESFPQQGMSGGSVSLDWWNETGLPLLKERYRGSFAVKESGKPSN